jgi:hypothetical protein
MECVCVRQLLQKSATDRTALISRFLGKSALIGNIDDIKEIITLTVLDSFFKCQWVTVKVDGQS